MIGTDRGRYINNKWQAEHRYQNLDCMKLFISDKNELPLNINSHETSDNKLLYI